jgi:hypothetical protein
MKVWIGYFNEFGTYVLGNERNAHAFQHFSSSSELNTNLILLALKCQLRKVQLEEDL